MTNRQTLGILFASLALGCGEPPGAGPAQRGSALSSTPANKIYFVDANLKRGSFGEEDTNALNFLDFIAQRSQPYIPDLLTLQEMKNAPGSPSHHSCAEHAEKLQAYLLRETGTTVSYRTADTDTAIGGACVLWRADRFTKESQSPNVANFNNPPRCDGGSDAYSFAVRLVDRLSASQRISVASVHLPVHSEGCVGAGLRALRDQMTGPLQILAGDFNATIHSGGWDEDLKRSGWVDVRPEDGSGEDWTFGEGRSRIDYTWVKGQERIPLKRIVSHAQAHGISGKDYSDHRGMTMLIEY
ncbi:MAG: hypothetical protein U1A78_19520 [Polyangia bacterium]